MKKAGIKIPEKEKYPQFELRASSHSVVFLLAVHCVFQFAHNLEDRFFFGRSAIREQLGHFLRVDLIYRRDIGAKDGIRRYLECFHNLNESRKLHSCLSEFHITDQGQLKISFLRQICMAHAFGNPRIADSAPDNELFGLNAVFHHTPPNISNRLYLRIFYHHSAKKYIIVPL